MILTEEFLEELVSDYYLQCEILSNENDQNDELFESFRNDSIYSKYYSYFDFSDHNRDEVISLYVMELKKIISEFGNDSFSDDEKILNYLEYFRLFVSYLPYKSSTDYPYLSNESRYMSSLLGHGTCISQAYFLRDLLKYSNIKKYGEFNITETNIGHSHTFISGKDMMSGDNIFIDPVLYRGSVISLEQTLRRDNARHLSDFFIDESQIFDARNRVLSYGVFKCGFNNSEEDINEISNSLLDASCFDACFNSGCTSVLGKKMDIGKVFEMYCYALNINYNFICSEDRRNAVYSIYNNDTVHQYDFRSMFCNESIRRRHSSKYCAK
ncbi:MAG: hypothetical protein RR984_01370 [Bacilli bacterium]